MYAFNNPVCLASSGEIDYYNTFSCTPSTETAVPSACADSLPTLTTPSVDNGQWITMYTFDETTAGANCLSASPAVMSYKTGACKQEDVSTFQVINLISEDADQIVVEIAAFIGGDCTGQPVATLQMSAPTSCTGNSRASYGSRPTISAADLANGQIEMFCNEKPCTFASAVEFSYTGGGLCYPYEDGRSVKHLCGKSEFSATVFESSDCTGLVDPSESEIASTPNVACSAPVGVYTYHSSTCAPEPISLSSISLSLCFAGSETVALESGELKSVAEVRVGDRVLAADMQGKMLFADVVAVPHATNSDRALFVHLATASGRDLRLTPAHLLLAGRCGESLSLVPASSVSAGMCAQTVDGQEEVVAAELLEGRGVYSLVTSEALVVVSGFVASPFAVNHAAASAFYAFHRLAFRMGVGALLHTPLLRRAMGAFGNVVVSM